MRVLPASLLPEGEGKDEGSLRRYTLTSILSQRERK
jgi:hypothetical protein